MTAPTPAPADYDENQVIKVSPSQMETYATSLDSIVADINTHMTNISNTWQSLKLSWVGQTQTEADAFNNEWLQAITEMFGDPKADPNSTATPPPGQAALGKIQSLVKGASANYANTEDSLCHNLLQFGDSLTGVAYTADAPLPPGNQIPTPNDPGTTKADQPDTYSVNGGRGADPADKNNTGPDAPVSEHNDPLPPPGK